MTKLKDNEKEKVSVRIEIHDSTVLVQSMVEIKDTRIGFYTSTDLIQSMVGSILFSLSESSGIFANLKMAMKCIMARRSRD